MKKGSLTMEKERGRQDYDDEEKKKKLSQRRRVGRNVRQMRDNEKKSER